MIFITTKVLSVDGPSIFSSWYLIYMICHSNMPHWLISRDGMEVGLDPLVQRVWFQYLSSSLRSFLSEIGLDICFTTITSVSSSPVIPGLASPVTIHLIIITTNASKYLVTPLGTRGRAKSGLHSTMHKIPLPPEEQRRFGNLRFQQKVSWHLPTLLSWSSSTTDLPEECQSYQLKFDHSNSIEPKGACTRNWIVPSIRSPAGVSLKVRKVCLGTIQQQPSLFTKTAVVL